MPKVAYGYITMLSLSREIKTAIGPRRMLSLQLAIEEKAVSNNKTYFLLPSSGESPLLTAVHKDDTHIIQLLMQCGAHLSSADKSHTSDMLLRAVKNGSLKRLDSLKLAGADLDTPDELLQTPLHKVCLI